MEEEEKFINMERNSSWILTHNQQHWCTTGQTEQKGFRIICLKRGINSQEGFHCATKTGRSGRKGVCADEAGGKNTSS